MRPGADQGYEVLATGTVPHEPTWDERRIARRRRYVDVRDTPADWPSNDTLPGARDDPVTSRAWAPPVDTTPEPWPDTPPY